MKKNIPKNHHTVAQVVLKQFSYLNEYDNEKLFLYDKKTQKCPISKPLEKVTTRKHFYTKFNNNGDKDTSLETFFANEIEAKYLNIVEMIQKNGITKQVKQDLSEFLSYQFIRTIGFKKWLDDSTKKFFEGIVGLGTFLDVFNLKNRFEIFDGIKNILENEQIEMKNNERIEIIKEMSSLISSTINQQSWTLLKNETDLPFITGDQPFYCVNENLQPQTSPYEFIKEGTYKFMPLTKNYAICIGIGESDGVIQLSEDEVDQVNVLTFESAEQYVIADDEEVLKLYIE